MNKNLVITVLVALVATGAGFAGGFKYSDYQRTKNRAVLGRQFAGRAGLPAGRQGFRPVAGEVLSVEDKSLTVKMQDGSSKIVVLSGTTVISKSDTAAVADIKVGDKVGVFGTDNSDGSVTAQSVQLNFQIRP